MFMEDKIFNNKKLNVAEKIVMNYLIKGHLRVKYISMDVIAEKTGISKSSVSRILKKFVDDNLILQVKPLGKKYYFTILTNDIFYQFVDQPYVDEDLSNIKDENILMIANNLRSRYKPDHDDDAQKAKDIFDRLYG